VNYEGIAYHLADEVIVVPALWSGPRRLIDDTPIPPFRPVQRSPEHPEGIETVDNPESSLVDRAGLKSWLAARRRRAAGTRDGPAA
jgi:hypothetical protein